MHLGRDLLIGIRWRWAYSPRFGPARWWVAWVAHALERAWIEARARGHDFPTGVQWVWARTPRLRTGGRRVAGLGVWVAHALERAWIEARDRGHDFLAGVQEAGRRALRLRAAGRRVAGLGVWVAHALERARIEARDRGHDFLAGVRLPSLRFTWSRPALGQRGIRRAAIGVVLTALASTAAFTLVAPIFRARTTVPHDGALSIAAKIPSDDHTLGVPAQPSSAPPPGKPEATSRIVTGPAMPGAVVPPVNATGPATAPPDDRTLSNREAAIHPTTVASARTELPVEVVAIRFRVIERTPSKWTWSWRLTMQGRDEAARVNARIEFIEFQDSTSRVLGSEEICGLRLAGKPLMFIEGIHTLSAEESQRVSTMTATFSEATRCGGVTERRRS